MDNKIEPIIKMEKFNLFSISLKESKIELRFIELTSNQFLLNLNER